MSNPARPKAPRITRRLCESGALAGFAECRRVSTVDGHVDGVPISLCSACAAHHAPDLDAPWSPLSLTRPASHLRELARGMAPVTDPKRAGALGVPIGSLVPVLTLVEAAALLGMRGPQGVQTAERREAGKGSEPGSLSLSSLLTRAAAYNLDLEVRVRRRT